MKLSRVETEALRQFRTRLNKPAVSDAASATLGRAFFQVVVRSDLAPAPTAAGGDAKDNASIETLLAGIGAADMAGLNRLLATLHARLSNPAAWRRLQAAGVPQAVISRRLQLAGREPDPNVAS